MRIDEVAHWSGALPLALLVVLGAMGRRVPAAYWWVASSFAVSVCGDSIQGLTGGTLDNTFYYVPPQIAIGLAALCLKDKSTVVAIFGFVGVLGWVSAHASTTPYEWAVATAGGFAIAVLARKTRTLAVPLFVYFAVGTVLYLAMSDVYVPGGPVDPRFLPRWSAYQGCRWLAFALFAYAALRHEEDVWT